MSGFEVLTDGQIIWEDAEPRNFRVDAAIYYEGAPGHWRPHKVFGMWDHDRPQWRGADTSTFYEFDCDYVGEQLYYHSSGSGRVAVGGGRVAVGPLSNSSTCPARIWVREGVDVVGSDCLRDGGRLAPQFDLLVLDDEALRDRGYQRVHGPMPDPFSDAIEGEVVWCELCDGNVSEDDVGWCCVCGEGVHIHQGSAVAIFNPEEGGLDISGTYVVLRLPFMTQGLVGLGWFHGEALARIGDLPPGADAGGYAGAALCPSCAPAPGPSPPPLTSYQLGLLKRLAGKQFHDFKDRDRLRLLALGCKASLEYGSPERARLLEEARRLATAGDVHAVRRLVRACFEE